jgi:uncharacterized membrane protein
MAHLVKINEPRNESERRAQHRLSETLPASWLVTTNIKEHNFLGRRKPELDSVIICPFGIWILDFKNNRGVITPMSNGAWLGSNEKSKNPFEQGNDNLYPLKDLLRSYEERLGEFRIEYLIVLTNKDVELDWKQSDVNPDLRKHVALIGDVKAKISQFSRHKAPLNAQLARQALAALKPRTSLPDEPFTHSDWITSDKVARAPTGRVARSDVPQAKRPVSKGKVITRIVGAPPAKRARPPLSRSKRIAKRRKNNAKKALLPINQVPTARRVRVRSVRSRSAKSSGTIHPVVWIFGVIAVAFVIFALTTNGNRQLPSPPRPAPPEYFTFVVCNQNREAASIAVMGRQSAQSSSMVVEGWSQAPSGRCGIVGRYVKGDFFAVAASPSGKQWGANDLALCVTAQQFRRVHTAGYRCGPSEKLLYFKRFRITDDQLTWTIPGG